VKGLVGDSGDTGLAGAPGETLTVSVLCDVAVQSSLAVSTWKYVTICVKQAAVQIL